MNVLRTLMPAAALAAALAVSASANATTLVSIGLSTDNGTTIVTEGTDPANAGITNVSFNGWTVNTVSGNIGFFPDLLNSNSFNAKAEGPGTLDVFVTAQGLTAPVSGFLTGFTENLLSAGWSVTESSILSASNALWGVGGVTLASHNFTANGGATALSGGSAGPTPYSITERFHIVATGTGNAQSTIDVTAVPEPATWGLMILGFGGIGAMVRNRRRQVALA